MSQEDVELVMRVQLDPDVDLVPLFRDDEVYAARSQAVARFFHADLETVYPGMLGDGMVHAGLDGFRAALRAWLEPWETYRSVIEEVIDCGARVLLLVTVFGRLEGSTQEVTMAGAMVFTVQGGKIARYEGYGSWAAGRKAVGLGA
jgi:ketosteroid isomerase-like protein